MAGGSAGVMGDMGVNSGSSKGSTGQWLKYWQEQDRKNIAATPAASLSGLSLQGSTQTSSGGKTTNVSSYGPTDNVSTSGGRSTGGGSSSSSTSANAAKEAADQRAHELAMQRAGLDSQAALAGQRTAADTAAAAAQAGYGRDAATASAGATRAESSASLAEREGANQRAAAAAESQYGRISGGGGGGEPSGGGVAFNEQGARDAAFARAKEQSAATAQASLTGLRNSMSRRGITGGGYAQMRGAEALAPAADQLQDFTREQLISDNNRAGQIGDREAGAALTRRGQDLNQKQSLLSLLQGGGRLY